MSKRKPFQLPPHEYESVITTLSQTQGWGITQSKIPNTWTVTEGEGETVMVIDTGWSDHIDLGENCKKGIATYRSGASIVDKEGHGCISPESIIYSDQFGLIKIEDLYKKCNVEEQDIILHNNITKVKDISKFNIYTISVDNIGNTNKNKITHLYKSYIDNDIINCKLTRNINYKLTPWHKVPVYNKEDVILKRADELTNNDRFIYPDNKNVFNKEYQYRYGQEYYKCNNCGKLVNKEKERVSRCQCKSCNKSDWSLIRSKYTIDEDLSYLCGVVLTDGYITYKQNKQYRVEITSETKEILEKCKNILENKNFGSVEIDDIKNNCKRLRIDSKDLVYLLLDIGILNKNKTYNQNLPSFVSISPYDVICSFIAGVIDGDGCISKANTKNRITGVSKDFIYELSTLLNLIGITSGVSKYNNYSFNKQIINKKFPILNCVFSRINNDINKHIAHPEKRKRGSIPGKTNKGRKICNLKGEHYSGFMYDFRVENDNTYFANGHFVSNTHCCGIIAAKNNDSGMVGVAPKAKTIAVKALDDNGSGSFTSIVKALEYAAKVKPSVVSMSLGSPSGTEKLRAAIKKLYDMNIPVIAAAGNSGKSGVTYPGMYPETITIAAYNKNGKIAGFSSVGEAVDFAAPGVAIYSTYLDNKYANLNGTSMACPFIAGVVALLLAKHKKQEAETGKNDCRTVEEIRQHLLKYTVDKGYVGKDNYWGYGVIDVETMLLDKNDPSLNLPMSPPNTPQPPTKKQCNNWFCWLWRKLFG